MQFGLGIPKLVSESKSDLDSKSYDVVPLSKWLAIQLYFQYENETYFQKEYYQLVDMAFGQPGSLVHYEESRISVVGSVCLFQDISQPMDADCSGTQQ